MQVGHPFSLHEVVVHEPRFSLQAWSGIGVQRLVAVHEYLPLEMQVLQSVQLHAREFLGDSSSYGH